MKLNQLPLHRSMRHPHTGQPIRALYVDKHGRPRFPIMGASPDDPADKSGDNGDAGKGGGDNGDAGDAGKGGDAGTGGKSGSDASKDLGFPKDTPVAQMTPEQQAAYHLHQSRKHEGRSKEWASAFPGKTPAEIRAIVEKAEADRRNTLTLDEKTLEDTKAETRKATLAEIGPKAVKAAFDLLLGDMPEQDKAEVIDLLDLKKFLTDDNEVDTAKVRAHVARIAPAGKAPHQQRVRDFGAGPRRTDKSSGVKAGRELFADRRKPTTKTTSDS